MRKPGPPDYKQPLEARIAFTDDPITLEPLFTWVRDSAWKKSAPDASYQISTSHPLTRASLTHIAQGATQQWYLRNSLGECTQDPMDREQKSTVDQSKLRDIVLDQLTLFIRARNFLEAQLHLTLSDDRLLTAIAYFFDKHRYDKAVALLTHFKKNEIPLEHLADLDRNHRNPEWLMALKPELLRNREIVCKLNQLHYSFITTNGMMPLLNGLPFAQWKTLEIRSLNSKVFSDLSEITAYLRSLSLPDAESKSVETQDTFAHHRVWRSPGKPSVTDLRQLAKELQGQGPRR